MTHIGILFMKKVAQTPGVRKKEYLGTVHKPRGHFRGGVRPSVHTAKIFQKSFFSLKEKPICSKVIEFGGILIIFNVNF